MTERPPPPVAPEPPFPTSLCHTCGAPPRYIRTPRSTFILCPLLPNKYPPQPVVRCALYRPRERSNEAADKNGDGD
ncbi:MAG TPA: hypothetical protein VMG12_02705 [Polyangiaceae bacterium]|nr:hypothetical protein [Polyangiaceae bacterium]